MRADSDGRSPRGESGRAARRPGGLAVGPVLLLIAAYFLFGPDLAQVPSTEAALVDKSTIGPSPRRKILTDPPMIRAAGFDRTCMECHRIFQAAGKPPGTLLQHGHIRLEHGMNDHCNYCHSLPDLDRLKLRDGSTVSFDDVVRLCAQCHGPTFRDWERGTHGRTNGFWDKASGEVRRLKCTECHDPHEPREMALMTLTPLPAPRTLRMGEPVLGHIGEEVRDPLRSALNRLLELEQTHLDAASMPSAGSAPAESRKEGR